MSPNPWKRLITAILSTGCVLMALTFMASSQVRVRRGAQTVDPDVVFPDETVTPKERKRQHELLKYNLKNMREDAAEMAKLANSIQEDLEKTTENELPLKVLAKAEQVEKLAKKIKNTAKGH